MRIAGMLPLVIVLIAANFTGCEGGRPDIKVEGARAELSPVIRGEGMVYLRIVNNGGKDNLVGVKADLRGATADLHEMKGTFMVLAKTMRIPAKSTVELQPGASHIMLENMQSDVKEGQALTLTLLFEKSGEIRIPLVLTKAQPMGGGHGDEQHPR